MDTQDVRAAKATITKNAIPAMVPMAPIASNTFGSEINIRLGPEAIPSTPENT